MTKIEDLTTGQSGFMVASAHNGYRTLNPNTCAGTDFSFHPEFATAKFGNFTSWAALQANVNVAFEIGHFTPGVSGDNDPDDAPCFPGPTVAGCLDFATGGDIDFDGTSYLRDWPDGSSTHAEPLLVGAVSGRGLGPLSAVDGEYVQPYRVMQIETDVILSETTCNTNNGKGCVVPPRGAKFYPSYAVTTEDQNCTLMFGNFGGSGINNFGAVKQYGTPNNTWFFANNSGGVQPNPCTPSN